ncbi:septum formation initiator family protein [candidate division KSB1 bacterium]|nr:septum formation initiator family protein [candidate division KSB1 bacterium]RQW04856.1 MAG: septum formation initiator family protein [candidate division KSB1 bacterium]
MTLTAHDIRNFLMQPRLWLFIGIAFILYSFIFERAGFIRQYQLKRENIELQEQLQAAQKQLAFLQSEIDALKTDIDRIRQEAIRHGYAAPDEVIIQLR